MTLHPLVLLTLFVFAATFGLALVLVPLFARVALAWGFVDQPNGRKVHTTPIPRIGGAAIFVSFYLTLGLVVLLFPTVSRQFLLETENLLLIAGSVLAFAVGLTDDFKRLLPWQKFAMQLAAAGLAYLGGIRIETIGYYSLFQVDLGWLAPVVSIFWIVLVINAFNLIDGLDGLAGGVGLIASLILAYVCFLHRNLPAMLYMLAIAGGLLGFLRYNFHPASVFMGDGGSYFLGYLLGVVSVLAAGQNTATMTFLVPMLAVALPVIDVSMAILRRFVRGQAIFGADKRHFHHMLLRKGLSHRNAVLLCYGVALFICAAALAFLKIRDERAFFILLLMGSTILYALARVGYFHGYDARALLPWLRDVGDEIGLSRSRRSFFNLQLKLNAARTLDELQHHLETTMAHLDISVAALYLAPDGKLAAERRTGPPAGTDERRQKTPLHATVVLRPNPPDWLWQNPDHSMAQLHRRLFRVEIDLCNDQGRNFGALVLLKNQAVAPVSHYTLSRIEHLRRSILKALERIDGLGGAGDADGMMRGLP